MSKRPFSVREADGVLELTLDTPGADFNILNQEAATQLLEVLGGADPARLAAVVIRSAKPGSFINGVGLMMAGMAQLPDDAARVSDGVQRAYRALRDFPVPTIAAIQGNCYGCGVEFSLHCDYRVAADTYETHFYMTEIADYLFVPVFGSSQDLPHLVGLESATDLLLWGERWSAREAARRGLVDRCVDEGGLDAEIARLVARLRERPAKRALPPPVWGPEHDEHARKVRARVATLPPRYQELYGECYDLLAHAMRRPHLTEDDYQLEIDACGRSVIQPIAKAALSFFFVRQLALHTCMRDFQLEPGTRLAIEEGNGRLDALRDDLIARRVRGVEVIPLSAAGDAAGGPPTLRLVERRSDVNPPAGTIGVALELRATPLHVGAEMVLYAPLLGLGIPLVEIACAGEIDDRARALFGALHRAGFQPILSRPRRALELNELLGSYLGPMIAYLCEGGSARDVHFTLRAFGFVRTPAEIVRAVPRRHLSRLLEDYAPNAPSPEAIDEALEALATAGYEGGSVDPIILDAVLTSLLEFATRAAEERSVGHVALVDLMAREVLDFPLGEGSLCRYMTNEVATEILSRRARFAHLLPREAPTRSERFTKSGRSFYQGRPKSSRPPVPRTGTASGPPPARHRG